MRKGACLCVGSRWHAVREPREERKEPPHGQCLGGERGRAPLLSGDDRFKVAAGDESREHPDAHARGAPVALAHFGSGRWLGGAVHTLARFAQLALEGIQFAHDEVPFSILKIGFPFRYHYQASTRYSTNPRDIPRGPCDACGRAAGLAEPLVHVRVHGGGRRPSRAAGLGTTACAADGEREVGGEVERQRETMRERESQRQRVRKREREGEREGEKQRGK